MAREQNSSMPPHTERRMLELEAKLVEQDHRLIPVLHYFFTRRRTLPRDDPRRDASLRALLWRILSPQTAATVGIGLASVLGLMLAYQANSLLSQQNAKIDVQNQLAEAARRSALIVELTSINERIDAYRVRAADEVTLPKSLVGRIVALSKSLRPYQYISYQSDDLSDDLSGFGAPFAGGPRAAVAGPVQLVERALSPERGQLLLTLASANIKNFGDLITEGIDFRYADLRGVTLRAVKLISADLQFSDFRGANFYATQFSSSDLRSARFDGASLIGVNFGAVAGGTTRLDQASFHGARLNRANFMGAALTGTDFSNSLLLQAKFEPEVIDADFEGAIVCQQTETRDTECERQIRELRGGVPAFLDAGKWRLSEERVVGHRFADEKMIHYVVRSLAPR